MGSPLLSPEIRFEQPIRHACEQTLMTEIELVIFKRICLQFFKEMPSETESGSDPFEAPLLYHDVELIMCCLCVLVKEQLLSRNIGLK
jgi:hypothetical protein